MRGAEQAAVVVAVAALSVPGLSATAAPASAPVSSAATVLSLAPDPAPDPAVGAASPTPAGPSATPAATGPSDVTDASAGSGGAARPMPGPYPSQDGGERDELGTSGFRTPLLLGSVALLLSGAALVRFLHRRRGRR